MTLERLLAFGDAWNRGNVDDIMRRIGSISAGLGQRNGCYATRRQAFAPSHGALCIVGPASALGGRVSDQAIDRRVGEF